MRNIPLNDFLSQYAPVDPYSTWDDWFKAVSDDPVENYRVEELMNLIREHGFNVPVLVSEAEEEDWEYYRASVDNGMHRVAAAHRLGLESIATTYRDDYDPQIRNEQAFVLSIATNGGTEDDFVHAMSLISFKFGDIWVSCDFAVGNSKDGTNEFYVDNVLRSEEEAVIQQVLARWAQFNIPYTITATYWIDEDGGGEYDLHF